MKFQFHDIFKKLIHVAISRKFWEAIFFPKRLYNNSRKKRRQHNQKRDFLVENTHQDHFSFPGVAAAPLHLNSWREKKGSVPLDYCSHTYFYDPTVDQKIKKSSGQKTHEMNFFLNIFHFMENIKKKYIKNAWNQREIDLFDFTSFF